MGIQINGQTDTISASDGGLSVSGMDLSSVTSINASGIITATSANVGSGITLSGTQINVGSATTIHSGGFRIGSSDLHSVGLSIASLNSSGISTFSSGPVLIGTGSATGTSSQPLQVTGGAYVSGNLGVGATNPSYKTHIVGSNDILALESLNSAERTTLKLITNGSDWELGARGSASSPANAFYIYDTAAGAYRQVIDSSGNLLIGGTSSSTGTSSQPLQVTGGAYVSGDVGIGTAVPGDKLDVSGNIAVGNVSGGVEGGQITIRDKSGTASNALNIDIDGSNNSRIFNSGNGNLVLGNLTGGSGSVKLYTNASERFSINSSGNVGIGTTNPQVILDVVTSADAIIKATTSGSIQSSMVTLIGKQAGVNNEWSIVSSGNGLSGPQLRFVNGGWTGSPYMQIDSSGRITMPSQVYVYASSGTVSGTANPVSPPHYPFTTYSESYDVGSNFNATTGVFTAPVTGKYLIMGTWSQDSNTGRTIGTLSFNGNYEEWVESNNQYNDVTGSRIRVLAANDTVSFGRQGTALSSIAISIWLLG